MKSRFNTRSLVIMGLLMAIVIIFSTTPIGSIPVGPLVITLNVIPIGIACVAFGEWGGLIVGTFFGLFSFLQCFGIGIPSGMGAILVGINPFLTFIQRVIPRALDGFLTGLIFKALAKHTNAQVSCFITGFCAALLNTAFFMLTLVLLFGNTEYLQELMAGKNIILFIITYVGINAVFEMIVSSLCTGMVGSALMAAKLISVPSRKNKAVA